MVRMVVGAIVGYVTMSATVMVTFSAAYALLGADVVFRSGTYDPAATWIAVSIALGLGAAVAGGYVCAWVARRREPAWVLAGLVLVLGLLFAVPVLSAQAERPNVRAGAVGNVEAMQNARQPAWLALLNPLLGAAGVVLGSRLRTSARTDGSGE